MKTQIRRMRFTLNYGIRLIISTDDGVGDTIGHFDNINAANAAAKAFMESLGPMAMIADVEEVVIADYGTTIKKWSRHNWAREQIPNWDKKNEDDKVKTKWHNNRLIPKL